jgi:Spy/CpxP family protein refolding chaperone
MKTITIIMLLFCLPAFMLAQKLEHQNPNAQKSYQVYKNKLDTHEQSMGSTIDLTYEARDDMEEKLRRKEDRRAFRRQLRLERVRSRRQRIIYDPYFNRRRW